MVMLQQKLLNKNYNITQQTKSRWFIPLALFYLDGGLLNEKRKCKN